jgi:dimethylargininase
MFTRAIVRIPGENFSEGLTSVGQGTLGVPVYTKVLEQHTAYCQALEACGLKLTVLEKDLKHPDSTFVEDTAVLTQHAAILTRPGAESREGEVTGIRGPLLPFFQKHYELTAPGTLDGGDICEAGTHFFIGVSHRTNEEGARQLADFLKQEGCTSSTVDIRKMTTILHLKSGLACIDDGTLVIMEEMADRPEFKGYKIIRVAEAESYAANCVRINERVFLPSGYPGLEASLKAHGFSPLILDMSEYRKMDGGLSCLSLRF